MTTLRNWTLATIRRVRPTDNVRCEHGNCNRRLRNVFILRQAGESRSVGSECVKAMTHTCDPAIAMQAIQGKWRQHRKYIWKKLGGMTWCIGQFPSSGQWWVQFTPTLKHARAFLEPVYTSVEQAKIAIAVLASSHTTDEMMRDWCEGVQS